MRRISISNDSPTKDWKRLLPGFTISLAALATALYLANPGKVIESLRMGDYRLVGLAFGVSLLWVFVRAVVWRTLLLDQAGYREVFLTVNEGYLLNNLLPFRLGELGRAFLLSRKASLDIWQVFSSIVIERTLDVAMAAGLLLITISFVIGADWARQAAVLAGLFVAAILVALFLLAHNQRWTTRQIEQIGARLPWFRRLVAGRLSALISGLSILTNWKQFMRAIGWMAINWVVALGQYYFYLLAFIPESKFLWAAFSLGVVALGVAAPSSPGAVGVMELAIVGALALFDLAPSATLAFALVIHFQNFIITGLIGAYALARDGESLLGLYHKLRNSKHP